jgi:hypothetical protein
MGGVGANEHSSRSLEKPRKGRGSSRTEAAPSPVAELVQALQVDAGSIGAALVQATEAVVNRLLTLGEALVSAHRCRRGVIY